MLVCIVLSCMLLVASRLPAGNLLGIFLWILFFLSYVCYVFVCDSLYVYMCFVVTCWERADLLSLSHSYPGSDVVLDCIDS